MLGSDKIGGRSGIGHHWILFVTPPHYGKTLQMKEHLVVNQEKAAAANQEELRKGLKANKAQAAANLKELREDVKGNQEKMETLLERLRSCGKRDDSLPESDRGLSGKKWRQRWMSSRRVRTKWRQIQSQQRS
jgi:hypothetical protein